MGLKKGQTNSGSFKKGHKQSSEAIKKRANALRGKHCSEETKKKISVANTGKKRTFEARKKMSESHKGRTTWNKGKRGIYNEETRKKMGVQNIGRQSPMKGKKHTPEAIKKMEKAGHMFKKGQIPHNKGKHLRKTTKKKLSTILKNVDVLKSR